MHCSCPRVSISYPPPILIMSYFIGYFFATLRQTTIVRNIHYNPISVMPFQGQNPQGHHSEETHGHPPNKKRAEVRRSTRRFANREAYLTLCFTPEQSPHQAPPRAWNPCNAISRYYRYSPTTATTMRPRPLLFCWRRRSVRHATRVDVDDAVRCLPTPAPAGDSYSTLEMPQGVHDRDILVKKQLEEEARHVG